MNTTVFRDHHLIVSRISSLPAYRSMLSMLTVDGLLARLAVTVLLLMVWFDHVPLSVAVVAVSPSPMTSSMARTARLAATSRPGVHGEAPLDGTSAAPAPTGMSGRAVPVATPPR